VELRYAGSLVAEPGGEKVEDFAADARR